ETTDVGELSKQQVEALSGIKSQFEEKDVILLHGVTGSGKTRVYIELIQEALDKGEQVLYLLPEIALTAQIVQRLQKIFGDKIAVYHSRMNNHERVELWKATRKTQGIILAARSGIFLPYENLKLIIVDEEHDPSFKQNDPAPRYNARDTAVFMAHLHQAKVLLGTATPSLETYRNTLTGKYGLVNMHERFGGLELPAVHLADMKEETKKKTMQSIFTTQLLDELKAALGRGEQAILFQNRRGYAPTLHCKRCEWKSGCIHCDVSLTYHKFTHKLSCHYCGYRENVPEECPACGNAQIEMRGFGTEKIEDELQIYLPKAKIARMDWDTVKGKKALTKLINDFEEKRIDILVGTQMVTKGLDFDNVGVVGILSADQLIYFPDFRASERAYQLMVQVSGRAGRKYKQGKVVIQTYQVDHPVIKDVLANDFENFKLRELNERKQFNYPPFQRMIKITLKHKKRMTCYQAAELFAKALKKRLGGRVVGPAEPGIPRIRSLYHQDIMIKLENKSQVLNSTKDLIRTTQNEVQKTK
ncbi:MAG: replication restart helicase PriA, partial [Saprospiraceae bacterium]